MFRKYGHVSTCHVGADPRARPPRTAADAPLRYVTELVKRCTKLKHAARFGAAAVAAPEGPEIIAHGFSRGNETTKNEQPWKGETSNAGR